MIKPDATDGNLTLWLAADREFCYGHDQIVDMGWHDLTDAGDNDYTTYDGPVMRHDVSDNHRAGIRFDGTDDYFGGVLNADVVLGSAKTILVAFRIVSFDSDNAGANLNDGVFCATQWGFTFRATGPEFFIWATSAGLKALSFTIDNTDWHVAILMHNGTTLSGAVDQCDDFDTVGCAGTSTTGYTFIGRNSGTYYANVEVGEIIALSTSLQAGASYQQLQQLFQYMAARWLDRGDYREQARDVSARLLKETARPMVKGQITTDLRGLDFDLGTDVGIMHRRLIAPSDVESSLDPARTWCRDVLRVSDIEVDLDKGRVVARGPMLGSTPMTVWNPGIPKRSTDEKREGDFILTEYGGTYGFGRFTRALADRNPDGLVCWFARAQPIIDAAGTLVCSGWTEELLRNTFSGGTAGWTLVAGGGSIAGESTANDFYFDPEVEDTNLLITQADPAAADVYAYQDIALPVGYIGGGQVWGSIQCAHLDSAEGPAVALQRSSDSKYYQWDSTWDVAIAWYQFPARTTTPTLDWVVGDFTQAGAETFRLFFGAPAGGTGGRTNRLYYVAQSGGVPYPMDAIQHLATAGEGRTRDSFYIPNYVNARTFPADHGTLLIEVNPYWDLDDTILLWPTIVIQTWFGLFECWHDANNRFSVRVDHDAQELQARVWVDGVKAEATFPLTAFTRGAWNKVAVRWTGAAGELDLDPYTISVFFNGVKGTDDVADGPMTEDDHSIILPASHICEDATSVLPSLGYNLNGRYRNFKILPRCLSDAEIAARHA